MAGGSECLSVLFPVARSDVNARNNIARLARVKRYAYIDSRDGKTMRQGERLVREGGNAADRRRFGDGLDRARAGLSRAGIMRTQ